MGLLKLAQKHTPQKLEEACKKALQYSSSPSYKSVKNLLTNLKEHPSDADSTQERKANNYGITRGARYYGGNHND